MQTRPPGNGKNANDLNSVCILQPVAQPKNNFSFCAPPYSTIPLHLPFLFTIATSAQATRFLGGRGLLEEPLRSLGHHTLH